MLIYRDTKLFLNHWMLPSNLWTSSLGSFTPHSSFSVWTHEDVSEDTFDLSFRPLRKHSNSTSSIFEHAVNWSLTWSSSSTDSSSMSRADNSILYHDNYVSYCSMSDMSSWTADSAVMASRMAVMTCSKWASFRDDILFRSVGTASVHNLFKRMLISATRSSCSSNVSCSFSSAPVSVLSIRSIISRWNELNSASIVLSFSICLERSVVVGWLLVWYSYQ